MPTIRPTLLFIAFLFLSNVALAQDDSIDPIMPDELGKFSQQSIQDCPGIDAEELLIRLKKWGSINYDNFRSLSDGGESAAKGMAFNGTFEKSNNIRIYYTFVVEVKDFKYRTTLTNLFYQSVGTGKVAFEDLRIMRNSALAKAQKGLMFLLEELEAHLKQQILLSEND